VKKTKESIVAVQNEGDNAKDDHFDISDSPDKDEDMMTSIIKEENKN